MKNRLTVFGTIEFGRARFINKTYSETYIGGNGVLASLAAAKYAKVDLVGIIGSDMNIKKLAKSLGKNIGIKNVQQLKGKSFNYGAIYDPVNFDLVDEEIEFGVYGSYVPHVLNREAQLSRYVLFSGSNPRFSLGILKQIEKPEYVAVSTLFYHLKNNFTHALDLIESATYLFTNSKEYDYLVSKIEKNLFSRFKRLKYIFKTKGVNGVEVISANDSRNFKLSKKVNPKDPTNAGDVFVGAVMGMIAAGFDIEKDIKKIIDSAQREATKVIVNDKYYRLKAKGNI
ncbi:MAG: hypothetical protein A2687_02760 [Candidatus Levybacteria bacterium RIFCSPHIGHO2_01_FULL_38_26]|nr:MAG: hypothetical protein A2687_02760 [Candidatus Levybacteria bacterium RIFCSPHIGHO2_01_FULL_38_26]